MANQRARQLRRTMTPQEVKLWVHLRSWRVLGYHFRRQRPHDRFIVDFACLKHHLVVEIDGSQHGFHHRAAKDIERDAKIRADGFRVLRFWNVEVDQNLEGVLDAIRAALEGKWSPPAALSVVSPRRSEEA